MGDGFETLEAAEAVLERADMPIAAYKDALLTKLAIEHRQAMIHRQAEEADAEAQRRQQEYLEQKARPKPPYRPTAQQRAARGDADMRAKLGAGPVVKSKPNC